MIRQAAVAVLSLMPFGVSILFAHTAWDLVTGLATVWRMIIMTLVWIAAFAASTQLFWRVTTLLARTQR